MLFRQSLHAAIAAACLFLASTAHAQSRPASPPRPTAESLFQQALELHQAGDVLGAIAAYQASLNLNPDNPGAHSNLGAAYVKLGRYDEAIKEYRTAVGVDPKNVAFQFNLGLAFYKSAQIPLAAQTFDAVLALQRDHLNARLLRGDCLLQMGRFQDTIDTLALWEDSYGDSPAYAYIVGSALIETDRIDQGQRLIDRIMGKGESAEAHLLMATVHLRRTDNPAALEELHKAATLNPKLPLVHSLMGRALLRTGDQAGAAKAFVTELANNPNDFQANLEIGDLKKREQRFDEAEPHIRRALRMRPDDPTARFSLAGLHVSRGDTDQARAVLETIVADAPTFTEAYVLLATVYYRLQRRDDGDRMRAVIEKLNAEAQAKQPGARAAEAAAAGASPPTPGAPPQ
ncbi:MAG TPA: tetratricopeptide repeat protein [Luteitalea sp.]|nr:tetratricopeptide repeat protein [Luteitalea sp.]